MVQVETKQLAATRVLSVRSVIDNCRAQDQIYKTLGDFMSKHKIKPAGPNFTLFHDREFKEANVDVEACFPISDDQVVPDDDNCKTRVVEEVPHAASVVQRGPWSELSPCYAEIYKWLGMNGKRPAGPMREVYLVIADDDQENVTDVVSPFE